MGDSDGDGTGVTRLRVRTWDFPPGCGPVRVRWMTFLTRRGWRGTVADGRAGMGGGVGAGTVRECSGGKG